MKYHRNCTFLIRVFFIWCSCLSAQLPSLPADYPPEPYDATQVPDKRIAMPKVESTVYPWDATGQKTAAGEKRHLFAGSTRDFRHFALEAITLVPGMSQAGFADKGKESLIIVKEGVMLIRINGASKTLSPGSVALILPGDAANIENPADQQAIYYLLRYRSRQPMDPERGREAGGSFSIAWDELEFHPHDKGGIRRYFDRATTACDRFEMHVTTLNPGIQSHEPHTHRAAEIVLVMEGNTEMQIGDDLREGAAGAVYFLASEIPHAIRNTGETPCTYFAFQME